MYAKNTEKVFALKVPENNLWFCSDDMAMFAVVEGFPRCCFLFFSFFSDLFFNHMYFLL